MSNELTKYNEMIIVRIPFLKHVNQSTTRVVIKHTHISGYYLYTR